MTVRPRDPRPPVAFLVALALVIYAAPAEAYLDPGSGGMIVQLLLGALTAGAVVVRSYWQQITRFVRGRRPRPGAPDDAPPA